MTKLEITKITKLIKLMTIGVIVKPYYDKSV